MVRWLIHGRALCSLLETRNEITVEAEIHSGAQAVKPPG